GVPLPRCSAQRIKVVMSPRYDASPEDTGKNGNEMPATIERTAMYGRRRRKTAGRARFDEDVSEGQVEADSRDEPSRLPASILRAVTQSGECRKPTALLGASSPSRRWTSFRLEEAPPPPRQSLATCRPTGGRFESGPRVTRRIATRCAFV